MSNTIQHIALEKIKELDSLLTDRISDLHNVKMGMESRHTFILYRDRLWEIRDIVASIKDKK